MFGTNRTLTPHRFDHLASDQLAVTAIFATLQGEGPFTGRPAVFLRLSYCNLACTFCDAYFDDGDIMSFQQIEEAIAEASKAFMRQPMLIVTGGEPLMQKNLVEFLTFSQNTKEVQVETNGNFFLPLPWWVHIVISPKVNEKTKKFIKVNEQLLKFAMTLKFVISADMEGYTDVPDWALEWRERHYLRNIYLSPMNMYANQPDIPKSKADIAERNAKERISFWTPGLLDMAANQRNHEYTAALCMKYSCVLSLQQHLYAGLP